MNILLVKLSSLGDVLHNLPVFWDMRNQHPDAYIAWAVEEAYVHLLEPLKTTLDVRGIDEIIPVCLRRIKKEIFRGNIRPAFNDFLAMKHALQGRPWQRIIETQGLIKSALIAKIAKSGRIATEAYSVASTSGPARIYGIGNRTQYSGYEPLARCFYDASIQVPFQFHAVDRSRAISASALTLEWPDRMLKPPQFYPPEYEYGLSQQPNPLGLIPGSYAMCFHATARLAKAWHEDYWIMTGKYLVERGITPVFPWGNASEKVISERLVNAIVGAHLPHSFSITQAAILVAQARLSIGVDTGLTHLSAVLNFPTIELYIDSPRWKTEGYWSQRVINLGDMGSPPSPIEVQQSIHRLIE